MNGNSEKAKVIISKIPYITIGSVSEDGLPWNAPVFSAYDKSYNFYWGSYSGSQHSKNIKFNKNVFLVIYDSTAPAGSGEGVYIKATAMEIQDSKEIEFVHKLLWDRHIVPYWKLEQVQGDSPIRLYQATPEKVWVNTGEEVKGIYTDTRVEISL